MSTAVSADTVLADAAAAARAALAAAAPPLRLFIPLTKVDLVKREVWGIAAEERTDKSKREKMDYASSKPFFQAWSDGLAAVTGGMSLGNVRAMHQPIAAGRLISLLFDDANKQVHVGAHIVDDAEWNKCAQWVYTGFSVGGSYAARWADPDELGVVCYTANPCEISLVDNPQMWGANFTVVKADGATELRKFASAPAERLAELIKGYADGIPTSQLAQSIAHHIDTAKYNATHAASHAEAAVTTVTELEDLARAAIPAVSAHLAALDAARTAGATAVGKGAGSMRTAATATDLYKGGDGSGDYGTADEAGYADPGYQDDKKPRYPLKEGGKLSPKRIRAAFSYINKPTNAAKYSTKQAAAIKGKIVRAWKAAIDADGPPSAQKLAAVYPHNAAVLAKVAHTGGLIKTLWDVGRLAEILQSLDWMCESLEAEADREKDDSPVPGALAAIIQALGNVLVVMTAEEVSELDAFDDDEVAEGVATAAGLFGTLRKVDAYKGMRKRVQKVHDMSIEMGAACASMDKVATAAAGAAAPTRLEVEDMDEAGLAKAMGALLGGPDGLLTKAVNDGLTAVVKPQLDALTKAQTDQAAVVTALAATVTAQGTLLEKVAGRPADPGAAPHTGAAPVVTVDKPAEVAANAGAAAAAALTVVPTRKSARELAKMSAQERDDYGMDLLKGKFTGCDGPGMPGRGAMKHEGPLPLMGRQGPGGIATPGVGAI